MKEVVEKLDQLSKRLDQIRKSLKPEEKMVEVKKLEAKSSEVGFWKNDKSAKKVMKRLSLLKEEIGVIDDVANDLDDGQEMVDLIKEFSDESIKKDLERLTNKIGKDLDDLELKTYLSGEYDSSDAIISIHAGQGGVEAMDWAEMITRMYRRYFDNKEEWDYKLIEETRGEEAGIKSATILVNGFYAYGFLKNESGTHRLVRQSPFNADNLRQTSFALVEVLPQVDDNQEIEIKEDDLEWKFFRSSGKGGQNVNKVSTAVRLKHLPSGIIVESQAERRQEQNRKIALSILKSKLWQISEQKREESLSKLKGQKMASWGTQIRSYVLHPYKLVKDLRTNIETSNAENVLDGELDLFIESGIKF